MNSLPLDITPKMCIPCKVHTGKNYKPIYNKIKDFFFCPNCKIKSMGIKELSKFWLDCLINRGKK